MTFKIYTAQKDDEGRRLDRVLRIFAKNLSLSEIYSAIRKRLIRINGNKTSADYRLVNGDKISIADFLIEPSNENSELKGMQKKIEPKPLTEPKKEENNLLIKSKNYNFQQLKIIFENENLLFVNKPYGRTVHDGKRNLTNEVLFYLEEKKHSLPSEKNLSSSLSFRPGPLHRLDKETTGLIAFSKTLNGAVWFSENIKNHSIKKKYLAIIQGRLENEEIWEDELSQKKAKTAVRPLAYGKDPFYNFDVTLAEFTIFTGRKHQIRLHSFLHNHSLLGDTRYGGRNIPKDKLTNVRSFYLHAYTLILPKNTLNLPKSLYCPLDIDFLQFLNLCKINFSHL